MTIYLGSNELGRDYYGTNDQGRIYQGTQLVQGGYGSLTPQTPYALYDASNPTSYPGSGNTWYDLSGNNNNLTFTGSVTYSSNNGGTLAFSASYATKTSASFFTGSNITIFGWINYSQVYVTGNPSETNAWISLDAGFDWSNYYIGKVASPGDLSETFINTNQGTLRGGDFTTTNQWIFYAFVTSGSTASIPIYNFISGSQMPQYYEQGVLVPRASDVWGGGTFELPTTRPNINLGGYPKGGSNYNSNCKIGLVGIFNSALTETQILDIYELTKGKYGY